MKRVILECKGRLANQIICWANARRFMVELSLTDWLIVIKHDIPSGYVEFPGAMVDPNVNTEGLPLTTRYELGDAKSDCLWWWEDVFAFDRLDSLIDTIRTIRPTRKFSKLLDDSLHDKPMVGVHFRCGDFLVPTRDNPNPEFRRASHADFLRSMQIARKWIGSRFYLSSDGVNGETKPFMEYGFEVRRGEPESPIFDLFALSRCRLVIGTYRSNFGWLAAHYGKVPFVDQMMTRDEIEHSILRAKQ